MKLLDRVDLPESEPQDDELWKNKMGKLSGQISSVKSDPLYENLFKKKSLTAA